MTLLRTFKSGSPKLRPGPQARDQEFKMDPLFVIGYPITTKYYAFQVETGQMGLAKFFFRAMSWYINPESVLLGGGNSSYFFASPNFDTPPLRFIEIATDQKIPLENTMSLSLHFDDCSPAEAANAIKDWAKRHGVDEGILINEDEGRVKVHLPHLFNFYIELF